jgi:hypothetical protein
MADIEQKIRAVFEADTSKLDAALDKSEAKAKAAGNAMSVPIAPPPPLATTPASTGQRPDDAITSIQRELAQARQPGPDVAASAAAVQASLALADEASRATFDADEVEKFGEEIDKTGDKTKSLKQRFLDFSESADKNILSVKRATMDLVEVFGIGALAVGGIAAAISALNEISLQKIRDEIARLGSSASFLLEQLGGALGETKAAKALEQSSEVATMNANAEEAENLARATKDPKARARLESRAKNMRNEASFRARGFASERETELIDETRAAALSGLQERKQAEIDLIEFRRQHEVAGREAAHLQGIAENTTGPFDFDVGGIGTLQAIKQGLIEADIRRLESQLRDFPEDTYNDMLASADAQSIARDAKNASALAQLNNPEVKVDARGARITINERITTNDPARLAGATLVGAYRSLVRHPIRSALMAPTGRP